MSTEEMQEKIRRLPAWAREHIKHLEVHAEPNVDEIVQLRRKVEVLQKQNRVLVDRVEAMVHIFQCAATGGSEIATAVRGIVEDFLTCQE